MPQLFEACMVICFGISWPVSIMKSYKTRSAKGKSLVFLIMITIGYVCGILSKILSGNITYVFIFYCLNLAMLVVELLLFARNTRIDRAAADK